MAGQEPRELPVGGRPPLADHPPALVQHGQPRWPSPTPGQVHTHEPHRLSPPSDNADRAIRYRRKEGGCSPWLSRSTCSQPVRRWRSSRLRAEILAAAARHGASNVRVFGSVARGEADAASDVDFLVDFEPGRSLLDLASLLVELEDLLGHPVDVVTEPGLKARIRQRVLDEAVAV
jgi:predicted nucleotidyltransferase